MNLHYSSLPKCSRTTDFFVSKLAKEYRNIMSITFNDYNSFFFSNLIKLEPDYDKLYIILCNVKDEFWHHKKQLGKEVGRKPAVHGKVMLVHRGENVKNIFNSHTG